MRFQLSARRLAPSLLIGCLVASASPTVLAAPFTTTVGSTTYTVQGLVGVGRIDAAARDRFGETFGSISGLYADQSTWMRSGDTYTGVFHAAPDRGYNIAGTTDYDTRLNELHVRFTPAALGASGLSQDQISVTLAGTVKLFENTTTGPRAISGIDPKPGGVATGGARPATASLPELPQGFNGKLALDAEGIVRLPDGSWAISDEYGPSIYRFSPQGEFLGALPVAASVRPIRAGVTDYSSNNPTVGQPAPVPANPTAGRQNNQGFEGLALSPDGKTLIVALQSAARQDLSTSAVAATRRNIRVFTYDLSDMANIVITGEYVVQLPTFTSASGATLVAAQSELLALSDTQLLILPRDSGAGRGFGTAASRYRQVDVIDLAGATNVLNGCGGFCSEAQIAPGGVLDPDITPASLVPFLDINDESELSRFGLRNGGLDDANNLSEKWEGLALVSALDPLAPNDFFLFVANDNDFATTNGFQVGGAYNAGTDIDTMFLAYRVSVVPEPAGLGLLGFAFLGGLIARRSAFRGGLVARRRG